MNFKKTFGISLAAAASAALLLGCPQENPATPCNVGHGDYAVKYILESGTGSCAQALTVEAVGFDKYYPQDGGASIVAIQPEIATNSGDEDNQLYTVGPLASELPDENNFCSVTDLAPISVVVPEVELPLEEDGGLTAELIDAGTGLDAGRVIATDAGFVLRTEEPVPFTYTVSDVKFYTVPVNPSAQQFQAKVTYANTAEGCTATYKAVGLYPAAACETDADCDPFADYDAGRVFGSGIYPEFETMCDVDKGLCVLKADEIGEATLKKK